MSFEKQGFCSIQDGIDYIFKVLDDNSIKKENTRLSYTGEILNNFQYLLTCHIVFQKNSNFEAILKQFASDMLNKFGIDSVDFQEDFSKNEVLNQELIIALKVRLKR